MTRSSLIGSIALVLCLCSGHYRAEDKPPPTHHVKPTTKEAAAGGDSCPIFLWYYMNGIYFYHCHVCGSPEPPSGLYKDVGDTRPHTTQPSCGNPPNCADPIQSGAFIVKRRDSDDGGAPSPRYVKARGAAPPGRSDKDDRERNHSVKLAGSKSGPGPISVEYDKQARAVRNGKKYFFRIIRLRNTDVKDPEAPGGRLRVGQQLYEDDGGIVRHPEHTEGDHALEADFVGEGLDTITLRDKKVDDKPYMVQVFESRRGP